MRSAPLTLSRRPFALIGLGALLPAIPYLVCALTDRGFIGHDLMLHLTSWMEVGEAWRHGLAWPGWSPRANFGLGDAHLELYPPISFLLGGVLALLLPVAYLPAAFIWLASALAGATMYLASRRFVASDSRLAAALLYMFSPYLLTTSLIRFAAADLLVQAFLPFLLLAFYEALWKRSQRALLSLATLLALVFLTNLPMAIVLFYGLLLASAACAAFERDPAQPPSRLAPVLRFVLAEALGAALASFYLLPVWFEKNAVRQSALLRTDVESMLIPHGGPLLAAGLTVFFWGLWIITVGEILLLPVCMDKPLRRLREDPAARFWVALSAITLLFNLPWALVLWQRLPQLWVAQFPFRFLPFLSAALPLLLLGHRTDRSRRAPAYLLLGLLSAIPVIEQVALQFTLGAKQPVFSHTLAGWNTAGYAGFPEYLPPGVTAPTHSVVIDDVCVTAHSSGPVPQPWVRTSSAAGCTVHFSVFFHPYWQVLDEQHHALATIKDASGRLTAMVPAGRQSLHLEFHRNSLIYLAGLLISLLSCALALILTLSLGARAWAVEAGRRGGDGGRHPIPSLTVPSARTHSKSGTRSPHSTPAASGSACR